MTNPIPCQSRQSLNRNKNGWTGRAQRGDGCTKFYKSSFLKMIRFGKEFFI